MTVAPPDYYRIPVTEVQSPDKATMLSWITLMLPGKARIVSEKKAEPKQATGGPVPFLLLLGAMLWLAYRDEVSPVAAWVALVGVVVFAGVVVWGVRRWQQGRLGGLGGTGRGRGWDPVGRVEFAVVPERGGGRRRDGVGPGLGQQKGDPVVDFWSWLLHQAGSLHTADQRVVRLMWAHEGDGLVWGISVDQVLARSVKRAADKIWSENSIQPWLPDGRVEVSDKVPVEEGGGTVVRRYIAPRALSRPLHTALAYPDHPMAQIADVAAAHPAVDVQLRVDLVPLSAAERERVRRERLRTLGESDPDRSIWQTDKNPASVQGVRVMLRVSRGGPGHAAEVREVADSICRVLDTNWKTDRNGLTARKVSNKRFDAMWTGTGRMAGRDVPAFHWRALTALLAPPPGTGRSTTPKRPDPPALETFHPEAPGELMPIGVVSDNGTERLVGIPWDEPTDPWVDWTVGATGSGKTWHALSRVIALAETRRGFLFLDPHRTAVRDIKEHIAARHGHRILEIDLQATNIRGEPVSAGWNPLDLTVVPPEMQRSRIDNLKGMLPTALFPDYSGLNAKAPRTATILRKTLECLLHLNLHLPPPIQANIFCMENLLLDQEWRNLATARLPLRDQKWWHQTFPAIVGDRGPTSTALIPALNALEQWKTQDRIQALLGASQSTLRWRDIIDQGQILLVVLNNDGSETDNLLARLIVGEMVTAFKERSLTHQPGQPPFHLFLDEFQAYSAMLEAHAEVIVQELRKYRAKVHFLSQSPSMLATKMRDVIIANRTHLIVGRLGNPKDAEIMAKAMGGQQRGTRLPRDREPLGPTPLESRDLLEMPRWHFMCQITKEGELSSPFCLKGINADQTWNHLRTDHDITKQIAENTGLEPIDQRLDHYDSLPTRIAHWLRTGQLLTIEQTTHQQQQTTPQATATAGPVSSPSPITPPQPVDTLHQWEQDCIIQDPDAATPTAAFLDSYVAWCRANGAQPLSTRKLQLHLARQYGRSQTARVGGKVTRIRRGITLT